MTEIEAEIEKEIKYIKELLRIIAEYGNRTPELKKKLEKYIRTLRKWKKEKMSETDSA